MKNKHQLCPNCKTGQHSYLLDNRSPFCPHISGHNGKRCPMYVPLKKSIFDKFKQRKRERR